MTTPLAFPSYDFAAPSMSVGQRVDLKMFLDQWNGFKDAAYFDVGLAVGCPAALVAALHWRESSGKFDTYLSQGDKLGTRTYADGRSNNGVSVDPNKPGTIYFNKSEWREAATFALRQSLADMVLCRIDRNTRDLNALAEFTLRYNGLGYRRKGMAKDSVPYPDPYVLAGTDAYERGKFTSDGHYDPNAVDCQLGTLLLLRAAILGKVEPTASE